MFQQASRSMVLRGTNNIFLRSFHMEQNVHPVFSPTELGVMNQMHLQQLLKSKSHKHVPAFALDIDGVFIRGQELIYRSAEALQLITSKANGGQHDTGLPFVFLTNGGGSDETSRAALLSERFGITVQPDQVIMSHTPLKELDSLKDKPVLVLGKGALRETCISYGFTRVFTAADIALQQPELVPHWRPSIYTSLKTNQENVPPLEEFGAIFYMHDSSEDYYIELQIALDVLVAKRRSSDKAPGYFKNNLSLDLNVYSDAQEFVLGSQYPHTPVFQTNPDMFFSGKASTPRIAQAPFAKLLGMLYAELTQEPLYFNTCGKPTHITYNYAKKMLQTQASALDVDIHQYFGVGDNPFADIAGANRNSGFTSVFVQTGNQPREAQDILQPNLEYERVYDAIKDISHSYKVL